MPRQLITKVVDENGTPGLAAATTAKAEGTEVISPQAAYIITDILAGNTVPKINPYWGEFAIYKSGKRRPAAYKTGTTNDNRDVHAYGYLAPPKDKNVPALAVGVWMGNSNNAPNRGSLSLDSSAPLWSAILQEVSAKQPDRQLQGSERPADRHRRRVHRSQTRAVHAQDRQGAVHQGHRPSQAGDDPRRASTIDSASGLLWRAGCVGPKVTRGFFNLNEVESNFPNWQKANRNWASRAAKGPGRRGGPEGTRTSYFYNGSFAPFGRSWGAPFAPSAKCPIAPVETPPPSCDPLTPELCLPPDPTKSKPPKPP